ncbi:MAG TPA: gas vesicle protein K [Ktedonobacteraceae bacterium]|jgi:hypothetical protein
MRQPEVTTSDQIARQQHFTLLELLDRLLDKGVMAKGEVVLSVAEIDLVYLNLGVLLSSVKTVEHAAGKERHAPIPLPPPDTRQPQGEQPEPPAVTPSDQGGAQKIQVQMETARPDDGLNHRPAADAPLDPAAVEKGLVRLVLTLVDLLRRLMEKQALRRIEAGQLYAEEIERVGNAFFLLDEKITQLKESFGLQDEDLNIDLGPLGTLLG